MLNFYFFSIITPLHGQVIKLASGCHLRTILRPFQFLSKYAVPVTESVIFKYMTQATKKDSNYLKLFQRVILEGRKVGYSNNVKNRYP
jgi:hypothetical protein